MAELAAIGLASNVLQFVDVAIKICVRARRIHKSAKGTDQEVADLEASVSTLERTAASLTSNVQQCAAVSQLTEDEQALIATALDCDKYMKTLRGQLGKVRLTSNSRIRRGWESVKVAISLTGHELEDNQKKLEKLQGRLLLQLAATMKNKQSATTLAIAKLQKASNDLRADTVTHLDKLTTEVTNMLETPDRINMVDNIMDRLNSISEEAASVKKKQEILKSLRFPSIRARVSAIKKEHKKTFEWAFRPDQCTFSTWLREGTGTYFICGKAGSGKSTLMKFLAEDQRTRTALQAWAGHNELVLASHYFWNSGTSMQKSQEGLVQTLLYQVLCQCPHLTPTVCASRWTSIYEADFEDWSAVELISSLKILSRQTQIPVKFALFIDGLDEYTGGVERYGGTYCELIDPIKELAQSDSIKICVSSRPWTEFETGFGQTKFKLKLEDLTKDDIRRYIHDILRNEGSFSSLAARDKRFSTLTKSLTARAQGVFLWVFLVVRSLIRGLKASDTFEELQERLNELPDDLEKYFRHMLQTIEPVYWDDTVRILQLTIYSRQRLPITAYEFLDQERADPNFALAPKIKSFAPLNAKTSSRMKKRLNARCKDLLEVTCISGEIGLFTYQVDFLHRTVRDFFLGTNAMALVMKERPPVEFDPLVSLSRINLALIKLKVSTGTRSTIESTIHTRDPERNPVGAMLSYVHQIESAVVGVPPETELEFKETRVHIVHELMDELDRAITEKSGLTWPSVLNVYVSTGHKVQYHSQVPLLELAMAARISLYVIAKLEECPEILNIELGRPWLDWALRPNPMRDSSKSKSLLGKTLPKALQPQSYYVEPYKFKDPELTRMAPNRQLALYLLDHGANPNQQLAFRSATGPNTTVWANFLSDYYDNACNWKRVYSPATQNDFYEVMMAMIDKGADPATTIIHLPEKAPPGTKFHLREGDPGTHSITVLTVARKLLSNRRQVEAIEAALRRREAEKRTYLASIISWFRSRKEWL